MPLLNEKVDFHQFIFAILRQIGPHVSTTGSTPSFDDDERALDTIERIMNTCRYLRYSVRMARDNRAARKIQQAWRCYASYWNYWNCRNHCAWIIQQAWWDHWNCRNDCAWVIQQAWWDHRYFLYQQEWGHYNYCSNAAWIIQQAWWAWYPVHQVRSNASRTIAKCWVSYRNRIEWETNQLHCRMYRRSHPDAEGDWPRPPHARGTRRVPPKQDARLLASIRLLDHLIEGTCRVDGCGARTTCMLIPEAVYTHPKRVYRYNALCLMHQEVARQTAPLCNDERCCEQVAISPLHGGAHPYCQTHADEYAEVYVMCPNRACSGKCIWNTRYKCYVDYCSNGCPTWGY